MIGRDLLQLKHFQEFGSAGRGRPLPKWAGEFGCESWAQLFLKYVLAEPAVACVIPATGNPEHMKDNLAAGFGRCSIPVSDNKSAVCGTRAKTICRSPL